jgi:aminoglycoside phosphotransferase (APT) family kinase protein
MEAATVNGITRAAVDPWLAEHVAGAVAPFEYRLIAGGRSNLTFAVTGRDGRTFVLRRPPLGNVLESAHDMGREHRIIAALEPTPVPVPKPLAFCPDPEVNGAPFYVMEFVEGVVAGDAATAERELSGRARAAAGAALIDVLADLHAVDPDAVGLGELGRKDAYVERQLKRWHRQFQQSKSREIPAVDEVHRRLAAHVPEQRRTGIVHGDYRLGNVLVGHDDGAARGVLDWELCTLGDTLADVGWFVAYWIEPGEESTRYVPRGVATTVPGFAPREELIARYVERTGADLSTLDFYVALAKWKLACIADGVYARYRAGVMGVEDGAAEVETYARQVERLSEEALEICERME